MTSFKAHTRTHTQQQSLPVAVDEAHLVASVPPHAHDVRPLPVAVASVIEDRDANRQDWPRARGTTLGNKTQDGNASQFKIETKRTYQ